MNKRFVRTLSRTVDNAVLLTLLVILILAAYSLWDSHQVFAEADAEQYETYKPVTEEDTKSFDELRAMNPDVLGWITIYDTKIDYPLVQSKTSNSEYLSQNPEKEFQSSGSIYLDTKCDPHFSFFNSVIHGHHMDNRRMFGDLGLFVEKDFFDKHQYGNLFYDGKNHGLEFFAILKVDAHTNLIQNPGITEEAEKQAYIGQIYQRATWTRDIGVSTQDHIVMLSTCAMDMTNGRFILCAKLHDAPIANPFPEEEEQQNIGGRLDIFSLIDRFQNFTIWQWILILIALILITYLLYKAERHRLLKKRERKQKAATENGESEA